MSKLPDAVPCPDKPPLHLRGGYLCVAAPHDLTEACFSVPAVRALRHFRPQSTLVILCPESQAPVWKMMNELNEVITYPDNASARQIGKLLAGNDTRFESAISWEAGEAAKAFARAEILQRLGYPAPGLARFLTDTVEVVLPPSPIEHRVRHYLNFVKKLGGDAFVKINFQTHPLGAAPQPFRIALAQGSQYGESYQWPQEKFKEVVAEIERRYPDTVWVNIVSKSDVGENLSELCECSALLACDSEIAHLAAHVGLPSAVIFGPNEPEWKRPLGKQSHVVREHVACSPCYLAKCPLDHRCQNDVTVEMVVDALVLALSSR